MQCEMVFDLRDKEEIKRNTVIMEWSVLLAADFVHWKARYFENAGHRSVNKVVSLAQKLNRIDSYATVNIGALPANQETQKEWGGVLKLLFQEGMENSGCCHENHLSQSLNHGSVFSSSVT